MDLNIVSLDKLEAEKIKELQFKFNNLIKDAHLIIKNNHYYIKYRIEGQSNYYFNIINT